MTYEIGQKVMTSLGVGIITYIGDFTTYTLEKAYHVKIKGYEFHVGENELKPYKTPHERLIEMGYEEKIHDTWVKREVDNGLYKQYVKYSNVILIDLDQKDFTTYTLYIGSKKNVDDVSWVSLELSRILTEYLEWLEELK